MRRNHQRLIYAIFVAMFAIATPVAYRLSAPPAAGVLGVLVVVIATAFWGFRGGVLAATWSTVVAVEYAIAVPGLFQAIRGTLVGDLFSYWVIAIGLGNAIDLIRLQRNRLEKSIAQLESRGREVTLLNEMSQALQTCLTQAEAYPILARYGGLLFPEDSGALYNFGAASCSRPAASWNAADDAEAPPDEAPPLCFLRAEERIAQLLSQFETQTVGSSISLSADETRPEVREGERAVSGSDSSCLHPGEKRPNGEFGSAHLCLPLFSRGQTLGPLWLRGQTPRRFAAKLEAGATGDCSEDHGQKRDIAPLIRPEVVSSFAERIALANIRLREELHDQALRDALTGLFNRRYLRETLEREITRAERRSRPLSVIMIDVDRFKLFNDRFGHEAGDFVLQKLGGYLLNHVRGEDVACRFGGEEFVLILPDAPLEATQRRAEELREGIRNLSFEYNGKKLGPVTLSLGIATCPAHGVDSDELLRSADEALYRAKREGRDRVIAA